MIRHGPYGDFYGYFCQCELNLFCVCTHCVCFPKKYHTSPGSCQKGVRKLTGGPARPKLSGDNFPAGGGGNFFFKFSKKDSNKFRCLRFVSTNYKL